MRNRWDIFCRVVDNFGDAGVCWRLARQLAREYGLAVRLWIDRPEVLAPLCPAVDASRHRQQVAGVDIALWPEEFPDEAPADVVVEAFACELPACYTAAMATRQPSPVWINLEYLSAEDWIDDCHLAASPHPALPLTKHFFFPGFSERSGGLVCERSLLGERCLFRSLHPPHHRLEISLFCYDPAPVGDLLVLWADGELPVRCRVPPGQPLLAVSRILGGSGPWQRGNLLVEPIPFLPLDEYDRLLWECDLNFVRGEDSLVRALWAAKPFVWQIYVQEDEAHLEKLEAFLNRYTAGLSPTAGAAVRDFFLAWNRRQAMEPVWMPFHAALGELKAHGLQWATRLAGHGDLASHLVNYCSNRL